MGAARYDVLRSQEFHIGLGRENVITTQNLGELIIVANFLSNSTDYILLNLSLKALLNAGHGWVRRLGHDIGKDFTMHLLQSPFLQKVHGLVKCLRANF